MKFSIVVIGKNAEATLLGCIESIKKAIAITNLICIYEIIYVDSMSCDASVDIARNVGANVVQIRSGFISASLGRYLGMIHSKYENVMFVDSDMFVSESWFRDSLEFYRKYGAIIGERCELVVRSGMPLKKIEKFYGFDAVGIARNIGGFLMINRNLIGDANYSPLLSNEEEADFYAKFYDRLKVYALPITAYVHNNSSGSKVKIFDYLRPGKKNGYILSLVSSIKNGYFTSYLALQYSYVVRIMSSLFFYLLLISGNWTYAIVAILVFSLHRPRRFLASLLTSIFFPLKFLGAFNLIFRVNSVDYIYENHRNRLLLQL